MKPTGIGSCIISLKDIRDRKRFIFKAKSQALDSPKLIKESFSLIKIPFQRLVWLPFALAWWVLISILEMMLLSKRIPVF